MYDMNQDNYQSFIECSGFGNGYSSGNINNLIGRYDI